MVKDMEKVIIIVLKIKVNIMVNLKMELNMDMECYNLINNHIIKDIFIKDIDMEKVKWNIYQLIYIKDNGLMIRKMDMVLWIGLLKIKNIKDNVKMINKMD